MAIINIGQQKTVYKQFSSALKNKLIYAIFSTKARRSYEHSLELRKRGINTPRPLAYSEKRNILHLLINSGYLCEYDEAMDLADYLSEDSDGDAGRWNNFARFAAELHDKGILHKDLNATNVRVKLTAGKPEFSLIDNNRMRFYAPGTMPLETALENLTRFSYLTPGFRTFLAHYVELRNLGPDTYELGMEIKRKHDAHVEKRRARKRKLRGH